MREGKESKWIRRLNLNTPPQVGVYRSKAPSLLHIYFILGSLRDLVKISASWSLELIKLVVMHPDAIFSLMYLVLSWKTGLDEICKTA